MSGPEPIEGWVQHERWKAAALERAVIEPKVKREPEAQTAAEAFTRRMSEQADAERRDEALARRVAFEHPTAPTAAALADPLREFARGQRGARRRRRMRWR